jgi:hypothetical protein
MSLFEDLIEDRDEDEKIIKSFESKEELSSNIFEKNKDDYKMRDDVRKALLKIADEFIESLGVEFFIHDIVLTGSLANYNWSNFSDVDLHVLIDYKESKYNSDILKEFFDAKKNVWNEKHDILIKGFDVELYVQDIEEQHISSGVYSVLNNKWLLKPKQEKPKIDDRMILQKGEEYMKKIDLLISKSKKGVDVLNEIEKLRKKLKTFRQCGLDKGGEYSYENLTFKLLRRNGYIEKLLKLKTSLTDKKLSITQ